VRVAHETYVQLACFGDDTVIGKKGEPPGSPFFDGVRFSTIAAKNWSDGDDGACGAADGADHAKKLHWMIVPGHCWPLTQMPIALAE
jgi:hypothetical protein